MNQSIVHSPTRVRSAARSARRDVLHGKRATVQARALEILGILYRCDGDTAAELLSRHSQQNNIRITDLREALVAVVDGASAAGVGSQTAHASHFWLREIRNLGEVHRRSDRFERHVAAMNG